MKIQVNEVYENERESGLKSISIAIYKSGILAFSTNLSVSGNEAIVELDISIETNFSQYHLGVTASDNNNNTSRKEVVFYSVPLPILDISINSPFVVTNTNLLNFYGTINVTKEVYGEIESVRLIISNESVIQTNDVSNFTDSSWSYQGHLPLVEVGSFYRTNAITAFLRTTKGYSTNSASVFVYYDTNLPFTAIIDPENNATVSASYFVILTNYDNFGLSESKLFVISSGVTDVYTNFVLKTNGYNVNFLFQTNTLIPYVMDSAGNEFYGTPINIVVDFGIPAISLHSPCSDFNTMHTNLGMLTFSGTASVGAGYNITNVVLLIYTNDSLAFSNSRQYNSPRVDWSISGTLFQGTNFVYYFACANNDKRSRTNYIVLVVDYIKPIAKILSPTNGQEFISNNIAVVTYVNDTNFSLGVVGKLYVGGDPYPVYTFGPGTNTNYVVVNRGSNVIELVSTDSYNNSETNRVVIYYFDSVYVSVLGSDINRGTIDSPLRSINKGVEKAITLGLSGVNVTAGSFSPNNGLEGSESGVVITNTSNLKIIGGWNNSFENITGYSELNGNGVLQHILFVSNVSNLVLRNLVIRGGKATISSPPHCHGGGMYLRSVAYSTISNVIIFSNSAFHSGGGIFMEYCSNNTLHVSVYDNSADWGGGLRLSHSVNNSISGNFYRNTATNLGGGILADGSYSLSNQIIANVYSNSSTNGGGIILASLNYVTLSGNVYGNSSKYSGGVFLINVTNATLNVKVYNNFATEGGGGITIHSSSNIFLENEVYKNLVSNSSTNGFGGGICLEGCKDVFLSNLVVSNNSVYSSNVVGGGIFAVSCRNLVGANLRVFGNTILATADAVGGGIGILSSEEVNLKEVEVERNSVTGRKVVMGGGIGIIDTTNLIITNLSSVSYNLISNVNITGTNLGGGIGVIRSLGINFHGLEVKYNTNSGGNVEVRAGGGIMISESLSGILSNVILLSNAVNSGGSGGGVFLSKARDLTILGSTISGNSPKGLTISLSTNSVVRNSSIRLNSGVGVELILSTNVGVVSSRIELNTNSAGFGGGIYILSSNSLIFVSNSSISSNYSIQGGGIYGYEKANIVGGNILQIMSNIISFNQASSSEGGGGIYAISSIRLKIGNNIFTNNSSGGESTTIVLRSSVGGGNWNNLSIVANVFSGSGSNSVAIYESGTFDIRNHSIVSNVFILSTYTNLYRDIEGIGVTDYIPSDLLGIQLLNTPNSLLHDANLASDNSGN
ncbi:MAG: right-handed parallel beta-helix repeat-containing protein [Brevinematia bacterium]